MTQIVVPEPFYEAKRGLWRIDYRGKTFRADRKDRSGKKLTDRQQKQNVRDKVLNYDWRLAGDPTVRIASLWPDWIQYLGYSVTPFKGPNNQDWVRIEPLNDNPNVSRASFDQYYRCFKNHFLDDFGKYQVSKITRRDIQDHFDKLSASRSLEPSSIRHIRKTVRQFFEWVRLELESIRENPVHDIKIKAVKNTRARRAAEGDEIQRIFEAMKYERQQHALRFMLHTGMRPEEICGIPDDYDFSSGSYRMAQTVNRYKEIRDAGKTDAAIREVILSRHALADIQAQREFKRLTGLVSVWLFPNAYGRALSPQVLSDTWRKYARSVGSDLTLYELRHTAGSIMDAELSENELKDQLGHTEAMPTHETYIRHLEQKRERIKAKLDAAFDEYHEN